MIRAAFALLILLAGQACGASAGFGRPVLDWRAWTTGPALDEPGPTADLLGAELSRGGELIDQALGHQVTLQGDSELLLRQRRSSREQEIRRRDGGLAWSWRGESTWLGARLRHEESLVRLRNIHSADDFLIARQETNAWRVGAGAEYGSWRVQTAAGRSRGGEYSAGVTRNLSGTRLYFGAQLDRRKWTADQAFSQRRYIFEFPFRRETWVLTCLPSGNRWPRFRAWREILASEADQVQGDYNLLYRSGWGSEISWIPGWGDASLEAAWFTGEMNLKMLADDTVYLDLEGARTRTFRGGASTPTGPWGLRVTVGREDLRIDADDGSFESWPFLFWDVFEPDRMVLDQFDYSLTVNWLGVSRQFNFGQGSSSGSVSPEKGSLDLSLSHGWVSGGGDAGWRERAWVLWPFVFDYDPQQEDLPGLERNLLRLQMEGFWPVASGWRLAFRAQQLVPLIMGSGEEGAVVEGPVGSEEEFTYGGLTVQLRLEWRGK